MDKINIGKELRLIRKYNKLSLRELASLTGISFMRLGRFERAEEMPSSNIMSILEKAMNFNFKDLEKKSRESDKLFRDFLESLFYHNQNLEYFKKKISLLKSKLDSYDEGVNFKNAKILLVEYITYVLEYQFDIAEQLEDNLLNYFKNDSECNAVLHDYIGLKYRIKKDFYNAIMWQEKALMLTVNDKIVAMIYYHLSGSYFGVRKLLQAAASLEKASMLFAKRASYRRANYCLTEFSLVLKATGQYDLAIEKYKDSIIGNEQLLLDDYMAVDYRNMCWIMILAKRYEEALEYLEEASMKEPKHPFAILYSIWCNYKLERYDEAKQIIDENHQLEENKEFCDFYKLFVLLLKYSKRKPTQACLNSAIKIVNALEHKEEYERCLFYLDIVLDLLDRRGDEIEKIKYMEMKINLLENN